MTSPSTAPKARRASASMADLLLFFRQWLRNPRGVAAVAPSGRALADLITRHTGSTRAPVLELGPGTGVFTQALIDRGLAQRDLTLVEADSRFARQLDAHFPEARVLEGDAGELDRLLPGGPGAFGAIVCGLGFRNMDDRQVKAIIAASFRHLVPGGRFDLFTYGWRCSVPLHILDELGLVAMQVGRAYLNVPPAAVYQIKRRHEL